jgi:integrase
MSIRKRTWKSGGVEQTAWVVDYVDQHGKRRLKTFALKKDAEAWATNALHEVSRGIHAPNAKITIEEVITLWIRHCVDEGLERSTIEQREQHLRLHVAPFIGREKLATLTTPRLNAFLDQLRDAGRSIEMRRKVLTSVRTALAFARGRGLVAQNVASGIKVKSDDRHKATGPLKAGRDFPTKAELRLLIDRAPERWRPLRSSPACARRSFVVCAGPMSISTPERSTWRSEPMRGAPLDRRSRPLAHGIFH